MTRRRRRGLRFAMWACVACSALLATAWLWSGGHWLRWDRSTHSRWWKMEIAWGYIGLSWGDHDFSSKVSPGDSLFCEQVNTPSLAGAWVLEKTLQSNTAIVPLWFLGLIPLFPAFLFFRLSRRPIPGLCPCCHYDLSSTAGSLCPECGAAATPERDG